MTCPCHGVPWYVVPGGPRAGKRLCRVKKAATWQRYFATDRGREANARSNARNNPRRVGTKDNYLGTVPTAEIAADLNQQRRDFAAQQKGRV